MHKFKTIILKFFLTVITIVLLSSASQSAPPEKVIVIPNIDVKAVHRLLENAGFNPGAYNKNDLTQLSAAIARFQKIAKLEINGILDSYTWDKLQKLYDPSKGPKESAKLETPLAETDGLLNRQTTESDFTSHCQDDSEFSDFLEIGKKHPQQKKSDKHLKPVKTIVIDPDARSVNLNDKVFAVEQSECSAISGHWVILYEGVVTAIKADNVFVRLERRLGYRYRSQLEGIDDTAWWCIPPRRHCYSSIKFSDWKGLYSKDQVVSFPEKRVYNAQIKITDSVAHFLQQTCE